MLRSSGWRGLLLLAAVAGFRLWGVGAVGLGDDEAYYWLWSTRPDLSYFDHPGGVAWAIWASTAVFGDTPFAVRLPSVLAALALPVVLASQVERAHRVEALALGLFLPVFGLAGVFAAPDAAFLLLWAGALALARPLETRSSKLRWAGVGALVGSTLLFKITGVLLAAGLVLWSCVDVRRREWWRSGGPWLAIGVMVLVASPSWWWNLTHDWPTLRFHAVDRHTHGVSFWRGVGTVVGVHLLLFTPPLMWAVVRAVRAQGMSFWGWVGLPCWLVFSVAAFWTPSKLHWWAPAWLTVLPLAIPILVSCPRLFRGLVAVMALVHAAVIWLAVAPPAPVAAWTSELRGWTQLATELHSKHPDARAWVTTRYQAAAQLRWGARRLDGPPVHRVSGRADQFGIWALNALPAAGPLLLVCPSHLPCKPEDVAGLRCTGPKSNEPVHHEGGRVTRSFAVWRCDPIQ